jgi:hypothetical protein
VIELVSITKDKEGLAGFGIDGERLSVGWMDTDGVEKDGGLEVDDKVQDRDYEKANICAAFLVWASGEREFGR